MSKTIEYEALIQKALRNVVRDVLSDVAQNGLPGEHHFYITFSTVHQGVRISSRLRERFPESMTIVLQHRFWDMELFAEYFTISLSFGGISEKLVIPFAAMQVFYDPSAAFEVSFNTKAYTQGVLTATESQAGDAVVAFPKNAREHSSASVPNSADTADISEHNLPQNAIKIDDSAAAGGESPDNFGNDTQKAEGEDSSLSGTYADVVSLDAFRKK